MRQPFRTIVVGTLAALVLTWIHGGEAAPAPLGTVELLRDRWGVPHVFAETDEGAFYGLGYAAAQDRGFQMHYLLRTVEGRLSEVLGVVEKKQARGVGPRTTLEHDRWMRTFGFARAAEKVIAQLDGETRKLLEAYSAGVNDFLARSEGGEHSLLAATGLEPEPWTPADCVLSWWHFAQFFAADGLRDHPALSPPPPPRGRAAPIVVDDDAAVVRREDVSEEWIARVDAWVREMGLEPEASPGPQTPDPRFSHAWVVGGKRTTTGSAVLVSDPQTPVSNPSLLYEFHAQGATFNVRGVGVAGSPIVLIGFNEHVAWGVTALGADQADLFILKTDPNHPGEYEVDGEWLAMSRTEEVLHVKGEDPVPLTVRGTIFGPVVSELVWRNPPGQEVALCRIPMAETDRETIQGALGMMRSRSSEELAAALGGWRFPTANCIFGDRQGNIGYWSLGALPVRSKLTGADGGHAQDGSTRSGAWRGMIPYDILPHCLNPPRGYLVTANHRTIQSFYRVPFGNMTGSSGDTDRGLRIKERIAAHLAGNDRFAPEDVLAIQLDSVNVWRREIVRIGYKVLETEPDRLSPNAREALRYLRSWYSRGARSDLSVPGTELVNEMTVIFRGGVYDVVLKYGGGVSGLARFAKTVRARDAEAPDGAVPEEERSFVDQVLDQAWRRTQARYGPDPALWSSRAQEALCRETLGYMESLDGFPSLDARLDAPLPLLRTVDGGTILSQRAQAYTQFVPLHDPDGALSILPPGTSDDPRSPYRFSTYGDWAAGRLHPAPLSRGAVEKIAASRERLDRGAEPAPRPRATAARPADAARDPLPGRAPDDPELQAAIRYLNRPERTAEEVTAKLAELREIARSSPDLKAELSAGLERFIHVMRESQAGRLPIRYGTPETLRLVDAFYGELTRADGDG